LTTSAGGAIRVRFGAGGIASATTTASGPPCPGTAASETAAGGGSGFDAGFDADVGGADDG
jgi:hypothetical protein